MFVLLNVHSLMRPYAEKLLMGDRQDDMAEDDASKWQRLGKLAAIGPTLPIGDFQNAASPSRLATQGKRNDG